MNSEKLNDAYESIVRGGAILTISAVASQAFGFLENILLSRAFSVETYGAISVALTVITVGSAISQLGLGAGAKRYISEYDPTAQSEEASQVLLFCLLIPGAISGISAFGLLIFSNQLVLSFSDNKLIASVISGFAIILLLKTLLDISSEALLARNRTGFSEVAGTFGQRSIRLCVSAAVFFAGTSVFYYSYILSGAFILLMIVCILLLSKNFHIPRHLSQSEHLPGPIISFSFPLFLSTISGRILSAADYLLIGILSSAEGVGLYRPAFLIATVVALLFRTGNRIYYPIATRFHSNGEVATFQRFLSVFLFWTFVLTVPVFIWVSLFSSQILSVLFGPTYSQASILVTIIAFAMFVDVFVGPVGTLLEIFEQTRLVSISYGIAAVINILLNITLIPKFGIIGAASATAFSLILLNLLQYWGAINCTQFQRPWKRMVKTVIIGVLLPVPLILISVPDIVVVVLAIPYFLLHLITVVLTVELDQSDKLLFRAFRDRFY